MRLCLGEVYHAPARTGRLRIFIFSTTSTYGIKMYVHRKFDREFVMV